MTQDEAIKARHSVRTYKNEPLSDGACNAIKDKIKELNCIGNLHIQLIQNEPKAFKGFLAKYGKFSGVTNYIVMAGKTSPDLSERIGYYGEQLVLFAQSIGLNSCWVGLSYSKIPGTYILSEDEKIACYIAIGYGETQGVTHKIKSVDEVSNVSEETPDWFRIGVEYALLAPTAMNQQKFFFEYMGVENNRHMVRAKRNFSIYGYTQMDLGIAKYHFEVGAGRENFTWV